MKKRHISIILILLVALMVMIFWFSAQPGDESEMTSTGFSLMATKMIFKKYADYTPEVQKIILKGITHIVRKTAHFAEYAFMGFLWYLLLRKKKGNIFLSIGATAFYASSDELHQKFVEGRSAQISDVLLDTCGGCCGVIVAFILMCVIYCCTNRDAVIFGVWKK